VDTVDLVKGTAAGTVTGMTAQEVTLQRGGRTEKIAVNEIKSIRFEGEPPELNPARTAALRGDYENALKGLTKIAPAANMRPEVKQEIDFLRALVTGRQALAGAGEVNDAGKLVFAFVNGNRNSYHFLEASELLGDLLVAAGKFAEAQAEYAKLEQAPWPEMKVRGALAKGRALEAQGKAAEALTAFDAALALAEKGAGDQAKAQVIAARLGRASALAGSGKADEAVAAVEQVIAGADASDAQLHARAYVTLGNCLNKAGRKQEALLAFLHVDVLYFGFPQEHAEALANLSLLWQELKNADRALEARQTLVERYKNSRWAK
jgi:tetratricopeptide (TPR) repeat protein